MGAINTILGNSVSKIRDQFQGKSGLPFKEVLSAESVTRVFESIKFRNRVFSPSAYACHFFIPGDGR